MLKRTIGCLHATACLRNLQPKSSRELLAQNISSVVVLLRFCGALVKVGVTQHS